MDRSSRTPTSRPPHRTRVLCVDDSPDMTQMMVLLLRNQPDMESTGVLNSADGIVDEVARQRADIVVLDLTMPGFSPLEAIHDLTRRAPSCRVIAFSGHDDPETRTEVLRAGAVELVTKRGEPDDIIHAIRRVAAALKPPQSAPPKGPADRI